MQQFQGCLGSLPALQRRVLTLRSGIAGTALSRGATASQLHISTARTRLLERSGLRSLRGAAQGGGCGGGAGGPGGSAQATQLAASSGSMQQLQPVAVLSNPPAFVATNQQQRRSQPARQGVLGATASSGSQQSHQSRSAGLSAAVASVAGPGRSNALAFVVIAGLALLGLMTVFVLVRRSATRSPQVSYAGPSASAVAMSPLLGPTGREAVAAPVDGDGSSDRWLIPPGEVEEDEQEAPPRATAQGPSVVGPQPAPRAESRPSQDAWAPSAPAPASRPAPTPPARHGHPHHISRPAAIAASGLLSLAVSRLLRGKRR